MYYFSLSIYRLPQIQLVQIAHITAPFLWVVSLAQLAGFSALGFISLYKETEVAFQNEVKLSGLLGGVSGERLYWSVVGHFFPGPTRKQCIGQPWACILLLK